MLKSVFKGILNLGILMCLFSYSLQASSAEIQEDASLEERRNRVKDLKKEKEKCVKELEADCQRFDKQIADAEALLGEEAVAEEDSSSEEGDQVEDLKKEKEDCVKKLESDCQRFDEQIADAEDRLKKAASQIRLNNQNAQQKAKKHQKKTQVLSIAAGVTGVGLVATGFASSPSPNFPLIAAGMAAIATGVALQASSNKMGGVANTLAGPSQINVPPSTPTGQVPDLANNRNNGNNGNSRNPSSLNQSPTSDLAGINPFCKEPDCSDICKPPCTKIVRDEKGGYQAHLDEDGDGLAERVISSEDVHTLDKKNPQVQAAFKKANELFKSNYEKFKKQSPTADGAADALAEGKAEEGFLPDESFTLLQGAHSSSSGKKLSPFRKNPSSFFKKNLMSEFVDKQKNDVLANKSLAYKNSIVGVSQDNIFLMVHRRYQERRKKHEFIGTISSLPLF